MLQVHPDSTCDVCLDPYTFSTTAKSPHAIGCGHIFCLECLAHLNHPTSCPLCRKAFPMERVKKLHVDPHVPRGREVVMPDAWSLVKRLARCARADVATRTTEELIEEAQRWLGADDHKELFPEVDAVFSALIKFKSLQERFHDQEATITSLTSRLHREDAMRDEGRRDALVESGLNQKIRDLEARLEFYRHRYPGVRELSRENPPVNGLNSEDRANGGRNVNSQGNRLPSPPRPIWDPFTSRNPNFVYPANSQDMRTSAPPQPYAHQTGAGAVYYEGANYEDRVVPPAVRDMASRDVPPEREPAGSRSGHRDRSAERNRRRDGESDKHRRRRDRYKRDTLEGAPEPLVLPDEPPSIGNALGIHPPSLRPSQGLYSSVAPPVTSTSDPSTSRAAGAPSRPPTSHGHAPPVAVTTSVPGASYREASQYNSSHQRRADSISLSRSSSTPVGPVLSTWAAPDLSNPSLNSLGLSAPVQDVGGANPQMVRSASAAMPLTARDSVSSWGTADSAPPQGDLFSTLRPLASAPADSAFQSNELLPRPDGQLLGVGRSAPIATPQPQRPQVYIPQADNRSYSRHEHRPRSQSQSSSFYANYNPSEPPALPARFSPDDRGFPYASVPPPPIFPHPYGSARSVTPASRPASQAMPGPGFPPFPQINPPPVNSASRPPNTSQQYLPNTYTSQPQQSGYRSIH